MAGFSTSFSDIVGGLTGIFGTGGSSSGSGSSTTNEFQNTAEETGAETASSTSLDQLIKSLSSSASNAVTNSATSSSSSGVGRTSSISTTNVDQTTTSDPEYIALQKKLVDTSAAHAANAKGETQDLVTSILGKAALTFAPTLAGAPSTGVYNSSSLGLLQGNAMAQAAADSASAVLGYQTTEEGLAQSGTQNLLNAIKKTTGSTTTNTMADTISNTTDKSNTTSNTNTASNTASAQSTNSQTNQLIDNVIAKLSSSSGFQQTDSNQSSQQSSNGLSVICTALRDAGVMDEETYKKGVRHFVKQNSRGIAGYYVWARPVATYIRANPRSWQSKFIANIFLSRAQYIAGIRSISSVASHISIILLSAICYIFIARWQETSLFIRGETSHG